jgi:hypothetical protein
MSSLGAGLTLGILGASAASFTLGFLGTGILEVFSEPIHLSVVVLGGALAGTAWGVLMGIRRGAAVAEKYSTVRGRRRSLSETGTSRGIPDDG